MIDLSYIIQDRKRGTMYKVIRWQTDGTEEVWEAQKKHTLDLIYLSLIHI